MREKIMTFDSREDDKEKGYEFKRVKVCDELKKKDLTAKFQGVKVMEKSMKHEIKCRCKTTNDLRLKHFDPYLFVPCFFKDSITVGFGFICIFQVSNVNGKSFSMISNSSHHQSPFMPEAIL